MNSDIIKWQEQEAARRNRQIERSRIVFMVVLVAFVAAGIGYGLGRWPDVVAHAFSWLM